MNIKNALPASGNKNTNRLYDLSLLENEYAVTLLVDEDFYPIYLSCTYTKITGWTLDQYVKMSPEEKFHPNDISACFKARQFALENPGKPYQNIIRLKHVQGHYIYAECITCNRLHVDGVNAIVINFRDITRLKNIEDEMENTIHWLNKAQSLAHIGSWYADFSTKTTEWSKECYRIYGLKRDKRINLYNKWLSFVHPDDHEFVKLIAEESHTKLKGASFIHRIIRPDGKIRWLHTQTEFDLDENGARGIHGICHDITDIKQAEEKIRFQSETLEHIAFLQSHQVLSPISNILGLINIYNFDNPCDPANVEILIKLKIAGEHLHEITGDIIRKTNKIEKMNYLVN